MSHRLERRVAQYRQGFRWDANLSVTAQRAQSFGGAPNVVNCSEPPRSRGYGIAPAIKLMRCR